MAYDKGRPKGRPCRLLELATESSVVVLDDDPAVAAIEIPVPVALADNNRIAVPVIPALTNDFAFANDVAVAVALTDGDANRAHADTDFFRTGRQRGADQRSSHYGSKAN